MAWNLPGQKPGAPPPPPPPRRPDERGPAGPGGDLPPGLEEVLRRLAALLGDGLRSPRLLALLLFVLAGAWAGLGLHTVGADERAVVLRQGRLLEVQGPGLHWNPPLLDTWRLVNVGRLREATLATEVASRDEELAAFTLVLRYRVADPVAYLLRYLDAEAELMRAAEAALQAGAAGLTRAELMGPGQRGLAAGVQARLAGHLRTQGGGLALAGVNLAAVTTPAGIAAAVAEVDRARADIPLQLQQAREEADKVLAQAQAEAARRVAAATREREQVLQAARSDAARLAADIAAARQDPAGTRRRLYEEAVADVMARTPTVIVGEEGLDRLGIPPGRLATPSPLPPAPEARP